MQTNLIKQKKITYFFLLSLMKEEVLSLANPKYNRKTSGEREQKIQAISQKALQQIEKYTKSVEDVLEYADFMSRFILIQRII
ncbi:hypothetical protein [Niallia taxi]|uniref:hypothetical protein n=1 Tax=Niallia taxi TaxID=2499688 RepID=UPI003D280A95